VIPGPGVTGSGSPIAQVFAEPSRLARLRSDIGPCPRLVRVIGQSRDYRRDLQSDDRGLSSSLLSAPGKLATVVLLVLLAAGAGVGGYAIGHSHGADVSAAGEQGQASGSKAGRAGGERRGYAIGYRKANRKAYAKSFPGAYRAAYAREFKKAKLSPPADIHVPKVAGSGG
jgi:hypothetical protein